MIPLGDDRLHNVAKPIVAILLIIINVLLFLYELQLGEGLEAFIYQYGATPAYIRNGENALSLLTSMFLHGGWMHLIGNMLFLWVFGDNIEAVLGHFGFFIFYILGGLAASFAHVYFNIASEVPSLGASGAISACLGAYIVMFPHSRVRTLIPLGFFFTTVRVSAWIFLGVWMAIQVFSSMMEGNAEGGGVAWWAHIGGFVFGVFAGLLFRQKARKILVIQDDANTRRWI
ncbi:MAG: rhomboid family intramembrane serine protease [Sphingobacteriales bacterium]|nr:MAG: rhomboid family intramembrane serine protease [Sphingobacteriales bacterium]